MSDKEELQKIKSDYSTCLVWCEYEKGRVQEDCYTLCQLYNTVALYKQCLNDKTTTKIDCLNISSK